MAAKDDRGRAGEERAAQHLARLGFTIIARNWRCRSGEIDLVVANARDLVVVEVKTRASDAFGHPFEALDARKRARLWRLAMAWISEHPAQARGRRLRFAAVGITGTDVAHARVELIDDLDLS